MSSHLETFLKGWKNDDLDVILSACADDFVFDDPIAGRFTKATLAGFYGAPGEGVPVWHDQVVQEVDGEETCWMWWVYKESEGAALVKAGPDGVRSERVAYYTRPQSS